MIASGLLAPCGCSVSVSVYFDEVKLEEILFCRRHAARGSRIYRPGDAPSSGGDTSNAAARRQAGHLQRKERAVLLSLFRGDKHAEGVAADAGLLRLTAGARISVLSRCEPPLVRDSGRRRPLASGNLGVVWTITDEGIKTLEIYDGRRK
jgi:hypothetical protein